MKTARWKKLTAWTLAVAVSAGLAALVTSCGHPTEKEILVNGISVTEHLDDPANPCNNGWGGCYTFKDGKHHVYYPSRASAAFKNHEHCHVLGMRHTAWRVDFMRVATAKVTAAGCHYKVGQTITQYYIEAVLYESVQ